MVFIKECDKWERFTCGRIFATFPFQVYCEEEHRLCDRCNFERFWPKSKGSGIGNRIRFSAGVFLLLRGVAKL